MRYLVANKAIGELMKVKITYPAPGYEHRVGLVVDVSPAEAKRLVEKDWCIEVDETEEIEKVKHESKPAKK